MFRRAFCSTTGTSTGVFLAVADQQLRLKSSRAKPKSAKTSSSSRPSLGGDKTDDCIITSGSPQKDSWYRDLDQAFSTGSGLAEESSKPVISAEFASSHMKDVPAVSSKEVPWLRSSSASQSSSSKAFNLSSSAVDEEVAVAAMKTNSSKQQANIDDPTASTKEEGVFLVKRTKLSVKANHFFKKSTTTTTSPITRK